MIRGTHLCLSTERVRFYGISRYILLFIRCEFKTLFVPVGLPIMFRLSFKIENISDTCIILVQPNFGLPLNSINGNYSHSDHGFQLVKTRIDDG